MRAAARSEQARAWSVFWQEQGAGSCCLANASAEVTRKLSDHWQAFAASLKPATKVLDVGCGAGRVARALNAARPDLYVTGIDLADVASSKHGAIELLSATGIESLPFGDASFAAAVSQFGFEYARVEQAAGELARVLALGARFSFLVHHSQGSIAASERIHNQALRALASSGLRQSFLAGDARALDAQMRLLARRFPQEKIVELAASGMRAGVKRGEGERLRMWDGVAEALAPERVLSDALLSACVAPGELDGWLAPLRRTFEIAAPQVLLAGPPLAWKIEGTRLPCRHGRA